VNAPLALRSAIVTGATGPIGLKLIELLTGKGIRVRAVLNPASSRNALAPASALVRAVPCGLRGLADLEAEPCDAFFHLGWAGAENRAARNDASRQAANIGYTLDAAHLAARCGCKAFVGAGSQAEYGRLPDGEGGVARTDSPTNPVEAYGVAKFAAGRLSAALCAQLGVRHCWGRILSVYGEHDRPITVIMQTLTSLLNGEAPELTTPCEQMRDFLYAGDCADALYRMALSGTDGTAYPLGGGTRRPLKDYLEEVRAIVNPAQAIHYGSQPYPEGQMMDMAADTGVLTRDTAWRPSVAFPEGIARLRDWLYAQRNA
jgi:nucleoside-diphosphate-sugar epimerase